MNQIVQRMLAPISAEQPCGPDLAYDPAYEALVTIARGKPEVEIGSVVKPAEPPEWRVLREESAAFLEKKSKHLNVAVLYACSAVRLGGLEGLRDGLELVRGLVTQFWAPLHPVLDPEDSNDPTQRLNLLRTLTAPRGSVDGWLRYVDYLYEAELCHPKGEPPVTFDQLLQSRAKAPGAVDESKLTSAILAAGAPELEKCRELLAAAQAELKALDQFLTETLGSANSISFDSLQRTLEELGAVVQGFLSKTPGAAESVGAGAEVAAGGATAAGSGGPRISGTVQSRQDVVTALEAICRYYTQVEPNSPVPYLLRRAQKMVHMNFVEVMHELNLATADTLRPSLGAVPDGTPPPANS